MKLASGRRIDVSRATHHVTRAAEDYGILADHEILCVRNAVAWHRIEVRPGVYDWSDFQHMQRSAERAGIQIV